MDLFTFFFFSYFFSSLPSFCSFYSVRVEGKPLIFKAPAPFPIPRQSRLENDHTSKALGQLIEAPTYMRVAGFYSLLFFSQCARVIHVTFYDI